MTEDKSNKYHEFIKNRGKYLMSPLQSCHRIPNQKREREICSYKQSKYIYIMDIIFSFKIFFTDIP